MGLNILKNYLLIWSSLQKPKTLKTSTVGDWVQGVGGRTLYVGSRSAFMVRLYEKYKQKGIDTAGEETIRLELEIKPYKHARLSAFTLTASELVGSSSIYSPIYEKIFKTIGRSNFELHTKRNKSRISFTSNGHPISKHYKKRACNTWRMCL